MKRHPQPGQVVSISETTRPYGARASEGREPSLATIPLTIPSENDDFSRRLTGFVARNETLLIVRFDNYFSSCLDLEYICALILSVNALAMWRTGGAVTRLLVLGGDVQMQPSTQIYAFANQFRSLMQGGFGRIDNAPVWLAKLGVQQDLEPLDLRDFRRAVRLFTAARISPEEVRSLTLAEWYFGFYMPGVHRVEQGHFQYEVFGSHSIKIRSSGGAVNLDFEDRFSYGPCEVLSSSGHAAYQLSIDLSGMRAPFEASQVARYLDIFASLVGATSRHAPQS